MTKKRPVYTEAYRQKIIELHQSGRSVSSLARDFEPCFSTIQSWIDRDEVQNQPDSLSMTERKELLELRQQVKRLEQERDILEKATAWFARKTTL